MYVCEELLCFFLCSVSFLFLSLCSVVHYARDRSCIYNSCSTCIGIFRTCMYIHVCTHVCGLVCMYQLL